MPYFRILLLCFKINKNKGYHFNKTPIKLQKECPIFEFYFYVLK